MANTVVVTARGLEYLANYLNAGSQSNWPQPNVIGWGTANGNNSSSVTQPAAATQVFDVAPYSELTESRVTGSSSINPAMAAGSTQATYQVTGTITASTTESPGESFIVMSATKPFSTTLASSLANGATTITLTSAAGIPSLPFYMQVQNEVIRLTSLSSGTTYNCTRAQNGSTQNASTVPGGTAVTAGNIPGAGTANPNNQDIFAHAGFVALALNTNDSIAFTWNVTLTG